jgi:hypothetical protein
VREYNAASGVRIVPLTARVHGVLVAPDGVALLHAQPEEPVIALEPDEITAGDSGGLTGLGARWPATRVTLYSAYEQSAEEPGATKRA